MSATTAFLALPGVCTLSIHSSQCPSISLSRSLHSFSGSRCRHATRIQVQASSNLNNSTNASISPTLKSKILDYLKQHSSQAEAETEYQNFRAYDLQYPILKDRNRMDLVQEILNAGGYMTVSKALGLRLEFDDLLEEDQGTAGSAKSNSLTDAIRNSGTREGFLALGAGRELRMEPEKVQQAAIQAKEVLSRRQELDQLRKAGLIGDEGDDDSYFSSDGLRDTWEDRTRTMSSFKVRGKDWRDDGAPREQLLMTPVERLLMMGFIGLVCFTLGKETPALMSAEQFHVLQVFTAVGVAGHSVLLLLSAKLAQTKNRSAFVWGAKGLLVGVYAVQKLMALPPLPKDGDSS